MSVTLISSLTVIRFALLKQFIYFCSIALLPFFHLHPSCTFFPSLSSVCVFYICVLIQHNVLSFPQALLQSSELIFDTRGWGVWSGRGGRGHQEDEELFSRQSGSSRLFIFCLLHSQSEKEIQSPPLHSLFSSFPALTLFPHNIICFYFPFILQFLFLSLLTSASQSFASLPN